LEHQVGNPGEHAELGDQLIWFAIPLLVLSAAVVLLDRRSGRPASSGSRGRHLLTVVSVLAVVAAVATGVQVYRVGDSGARAAWGDTGSGSDDD
jgi:hypothetical protein